MKAPHLFFPAGTAGDKTDPVAMNPARADWSYSGLRIMSLPADEVRTLPTGTTEMAMLPLSGCETVEVEDRKLLLAGRPGVFDAVTDFVYVPIDTEVRISTNAPFEIALCTAEATRWIDPYYVPAGDVAVEVRGGGPGTRQINNFLSADAHDVPRGYHGPAGATPGHHMYYLNVMAGPSPERIWKFWTAQHTRGRGVPSKSSHPILACH